METSAKQILPKKSKAQPQWFLLEEHKLSKLIKERNEATHSVTERLRAARKKLKNAILD